MDCVHPTHVRDPSDRAIVKPFLVCLTCGILGTTCDRCTRFYATPALGYVPEDWCRAWTAVLRAATTTIAASRPLTSSARLSAQRTSSPQAGSSALSVPHRRATRRSRSRGANARRAARALSASTSPASATASTKGAASPWSSGIAKASSRGPRSRTTCAPLHRSQRA